MKKFIHFFKEIFIHFFKSDTFQKGAALAYYAVFSFIPLIVIIVSLLGIFFGEQAISGEVYLKLKDFLGDDASLEVQNLIKDQHVNHNSVLTTIVGFVILLFSASGMFKQIHNSFNSIWGLKVKPKNGVVHFLIKHISSVLIIIILFFLIFISTSFTSFIIKFSNDFYYISELSFMYEHLISFVFMSLIYSIMFTFFGDAKVNWKASLMGGIFTSFLFLIGKIGIGMYIGRSNITSTFGSTSLVALVMVWVYYISQIIFLGASFVKIYSEYLGKEILPNTYAVKVQQIEIEN